MIFCVADVGATNTRLQKWECNFNNRRLLKEINQRITSCHELLKLLESLKTDCGILVGGFAGPVSSDGETVQMTNWESEPIKKKAILSLGYACVEFRNDVELAAYGLMHSADCNGEIIHAKPSAGNKAIILPGTGLGSVGIIQEGDEWKVIPSEAQHAIASGDLADQMSRLMGERATWEDCVSGMGLSRWYQILSGEMQKRPEDILSRAIEGNEAAREAFNKYYFVAGQFSQLLALSFICRGGVYLAGTSTRNNQSLINNKNFVAGFLENCTMKNILQDIPLYMVTEELNLKGAVSIATDL